MRIHLKKADVLFLEIKAPFLDEEMKVGDYYFELQKNISTEDYLKVYKNIGNPWHWSERLLVSKEKLKTILASPNSIIYFLKHQNEVVGYFELDKSEQEVELVYFGLSENHIGFGLGKFMMNKVKSICQEQHFHRLWLHTCSFDAPQALDFYQRCGFKIYNQSISWEKHLF